MKETNKPNRKVGSLKSFAHDVSVHRMSLVQEAQQILIQFQIERILDNLFLSIKTVHIINSGRYQLIIRKTLIL